jgi:DsbC/DsbD-like thiol-disulfide interchange protein
MTLDNSQSTTYELLNWYGAYMMRMTIRLTVAMIMVALTQRSAGAADSLKGPPVVVQAGDVRARIALSADHAPSGHQLEVAVDFDVAPGWHIYGEPLPDGEGLTPTSVVFNSDLLAQQTLKLPKPTPLRFEALNETYPVYTGQFTALGSIVLNQKTKAGDYTIPGTLSFQQCNDTMCKMPQTVHFEIPIKVEAPAPAPPNT